MSRTDTLAATAATGTKPLRDVRGFWRVLLAVIAPLPMLAKGVYYLITPVAGGAGFDATLAAYQADPGVAEVLRLLDIPFVVLLIPAVYAVAWVARRGAPRLTTAGAFLTLLGCLAGFGLLGGITGPAYMSAVQGLDPAAMRAVDAAVENDPLFLVAGLLFLVGIVVGLGLLGAALWRSRAVGAWAGIALMVGGITHPFVPGSLAQGIGLLVAAVGFAGASVALLRMRNDEFDLPPARRAG
jgi:hypothetical protein